MSTTSELDAFGKVVVERVVEPVSALFSANLKRSVSADCTSDEADRFLSKLNSEDELILQKFIHAAIVKTTHYFLWQAEQGAFDIQLNAKSVADLSDGLSGELYSDDGWLARFGKK